MKGQVSNAELQRQYRVLQQTLSMHTMLRDRYTSLAMGLDMALLLGSLVLCGAAFVGDDLLRGIGLTESVTKGVMGGASLLVFFAALIGLRVGWKGKAERHRHAADRLTEGLSNFREARSEDDTWQEDCTADLNQLYWSIMRNVTPVPSNQFNRLKARHLRKVRISKMLDTSPGCPVCFVRLVVLWEGLGAAWRHRWRQ